MPKIPCKYTEEEFKRLWDECGKTGAEFCRRNGGKPQNISRYLQKFKISNRVNTGQTKKSKKYERWVILPDCHEEPEVSNPISEVAYNAIKGIRPHGIILGGDFLNMDCVNPHLTNRFKDVEGKRLKEAYALADSIILRLKEYTKSVVYIEGNHEDWVNQYIAKNPNVEGFLELKNNIKNADIIIGDYTDHSKNFFRLGTHLDVTHGNLIGENACDKYLRIRSKRSLIFCNSHRIANKMRNMEDDMPVAVWNIGCLCPINPRYNRGDLANWQNGFMVVDVFNDGTFQAYQVVIVKNKCSFEGKVYFGDT